MRGVTGVCAALALLAGGAAAAQGLMAPFAIVPAVKTLCMDTGADPRKVAVKAIAIGLKPGDAANGQTRF